MKLSRLVVPALAGLAVAACEPKTPEGASPSGATGIPFTVTAAPDAAYDLKCRFRAVETPGGGTANGVDLSGRGPQSDRFPGDNARCVLKQTAGPGPVTLTITKNGPQTATVEGPGAETSLVVF